MNSLGFWTFLIISYQTILCAVVGWLTLECQLAPAAGELHELTVAKLLYLYEPSACGAVHFYNYTMSTGGVQLSTVAWPESNPVAGAFRSKVRVWVCAHAAWLALGALNAALRRRPCALYAALLPFTGAGLAVLAVDALHAALFLGDVGRTSTEQRILDYIQSGDGSVRWFSVLPGEPEGGRGATDTSWVAVAFAYASCRGVVQWLINFWIIKDNYFEGLAVYRRLQSEKLSRKAGPTGRAAHPPPHE